MGVRVQQQMREIHQGCAGEWSCGYAQRMRVGTEDYANFLGQSGSAQMECFPRVHVPRRRDKRNPPSSTSAVSTRPKCSVCDGVYSWPPEKCRKTPKVERKSQPQSVGELCFFPSRASHPPPPVAAPTPQPHTVIEEIYDSH